MALKSRLRAAMSRSTNTSPASSSSSSTTDLSSSPTSTSPSETTPSPLSTVSTGLTLATTATTVSTSPSNNLAKTPSRLRLFLTRSSSSKKSKKGPSTDQEWHDYTGPRTRFRKAVDPVHRAQLEAWEWEFGRKGSAVSYGLSPCASRTASLNGDRREAVEEEQ